MPTTNPNFSDFLFSLANITVPQILDLFLVVLVYYGLLQVMHRSRATVLLRGTLVLIAVFFIVTVFLPLSTFVFLLEVALIATLVATPIIFQPELRHLLEELGRRVGTFSLRQVAAETALKPVARAVGSLAESRVGALIVLEGDDDLSDIVRTGVPMGSEVTSELIQTVFYNGTPLHDGAIVIRGDRLRAAGCVLPVSNRQLYAAERRLGTRHRAAVGLTETSDALVLVVSEETGQVSVAHHGRLQSDLDSTALREQIHTFYRENGERREAFSLRNLVSRIWESVLSGIAVPDPDTLVAKVGLLLISVMLALATWTFVIQQTNPIRPTRIENIRLRVTNVPPGTQLIGDLPQTVAAVVRAPDATLASLGPGSFQAEVSLEGLEPNSQPQGLDVVVRPGVEPVEVTSVEPATLSVQLAEIISRTVDVRIQLLGEEQLSPALEIRDAPQAEPAQVTVSGPAPTVESVDRVLVQMTLPEAGGSVRRTSRVTAVDEEGNEVSGVDVEPEQVQVSLTVAQREDARDLGVRVLTEGQLPQGYHLSRLTAEPTRVTLLGSEDRLAELGGAVETFPVELSQAVEDFSVQVALNLPPGVEAVDPQGNPVRSALVHVDVEPETANRVLFRQVEIVGSTGLEIVPDPLTVELTLQGPVPVLDEIAAEPRLVRVVIEASTLTDLTAGDTVSVTPTVIKPEAIRAQLIPTTVRVTAQ